MKINLFKKTSIVFFIITFIIIGCKDTGDANYYKIDSYDKIYFSVLFSENVKINSKIILNDLTDDTLINNNDLTNDTAYKEKYIYQKEDIDKFKEYESLLFAYVYEEIKNYFNIDKFEKLTSDEDFDIGNSLLISVIITEYNVGEYNLIKNVPTTVKFIVKILKKDMQNNDILLLNRKYKAKAYIDYATEKLRIKNISDQLSKDILKLLGL